MVFWMIRLVNLGAESRFIPELNSGNDPKHTLGGVIFGTFRNQFHTVLHLPVFVMSDPI
jgi:hypothetical protein